MQTEGRCKVAVLGTMRSMTVGLLLYARLTDSISCMHESTSSIDSKDPMSDS